MHPEEKPPPEQIDAQFAQIVQQSYGPVVPQWQQLPGYPQMAPKPPRRWGRWIALGVAVVVVMCLGATALTVAALPILLRDNTGAQASPSTSPKPSPARSPQAGDPVSVREAWVVEKVREALDKQRAALLADNEPGYLAPLDPEMTKKDRDGLARQFRSLREMQVAQWTDDVTSASDRSNDKWSVMVVSSACFVKPVCANAGAAAQTVWRVAGATATLVSWTPDEQIHPWQASELVARAGERTIVATTKPYASRLPSLVAEAEKAAIIADRFARDGKTPARYVVYYAATPEWKQWFGWTPPDWSGGVAIDVSDDRYELVLNADYLHPSAVDDLLRHELTHASSLPGRYTNSRALWWLIEGIAELAEMEGSPASSHPGASEISKLIANGTVTGLDVTPPTSSADEEIVAARYGVAFLGVRCISERFGEEKLVQFFHRVVHDGIALSAAAPQILNMEWQPLNSECFSYVKETAG